MKIYIRTRKEKVENAIPLFFALPTSEFETHTWGCCRKEIDAFRGNMQSKYLKSKWESPIEWHTGFFI